jgi:hypothetical protein
MNFSSVQPSAPLHLVIPRRLPGLGFGQRPSAARSRSCGDGGLPAAQNYREKAEHEITRRFPE